MRNCRIITDGESALGFRLAGAEALVAEDGEAAERLVLDILREKECGLLLITEDLLDGVSPHVLRRVEKDGLPIVVPLPVFRGWHEERQGLDYVLRLIRRSIGYSLRITQ